MNKKLLSIVLTSILFISCDASDLMEALAPYYWDYPGLNVYEIEGLRDATAHLEYRSELGDADHWQLPEETWNRGAGDCEDLASISAYILNYEMGIDADLMLMKNGDQYHMVMSVDGKLYEFFGVPFSIPGWEVYRIYTFRQYVDHAYYTD